MILHWETLKKDNPLAVQIIEHKTGYVYDSAYGTLLKNKEQITFAILEGFFDNQGWFMSIYPTEFPGWNGIITNTLGERVFHNHHAFENVKSRNHAKSTIAGIAIICFEKEVDKMISIPEGYLVLKREDLNDDARDKALNHIKVDDLKLDSRGLMMASDFVVLQDNEGSVVIKNKKEFPFIGMVLKNSNIK